MNLLEAAFDQALRAAANAKGVDEKLTFRGQQLSFIALEQNEDYGPGAGGDQDKMPVKVSLRKREVTLPVLTAEKENAEEVIFRGKTLFVIQYWPLEGRTDFLIGTIQDQLGEGE